MRRLNIQLVTAPNYSVVLDLPRMNDFYSMKRIAIVCSEFLEAGIACALHPNGRTDTDFLRWGKFIQDHEEIQVLAYEFTTGPGRKDRIDYHVDQLALIRKMANRPMCIVVRGNVTAIPRLRSIFESVVYLESKSFLKTVKRQEAYVSNRNVIKWRSQPTEKKEPLDYLLNWNMRQVKRDIENRYFDQADLAA